MKTIKYIKLYNYLVSNDALQPMEAFRKINRIRKIDNEILSALFDWLEGDQCPDIVINTVSFAELTRDEEMSPVRAFMMLDWLKREPVKAMSYLKERMTHAPALFARKVQVESVEDDMSEAGEDIIVD